MEQADDVVDDRAHRPSRRLGVPVGDVDRDLLVRAQDDLGLPAAVIDQRVVQSAVGRAGIERDVLDAKGLKEVDDHVRAVLLRHEGREWYNN